MDFFIYINPSGLNRKSTVDPCLVTATGASRVAELNSTVVPVNKKRKVLWHQAIHKKIVRVSFCKKRTISWQKVIKQCKLSSVLARSCSNERKKSNQNVKQTWKVWHFPWGRGLGGWWFYEKKKPLCEKGLDKNYSKSPAEINELVAMVGGGGASHIHCVSLWRVMNIGLLCFELNTKSQCQFNLCIK